MPRLAKVAREGQPWSSKWGLNFRCQQNGVLSPYMNYNCERLSDRVNHGCPAKKQRDAA